MAVDWLTASQILDEQRRPISPTARDLMDKGSNMVGKENKQQIGSYCPPFYCQFLQELHSLRRPRRVRGRQSKVEEQRLPTVVRLDHLGRFVGEARCGFVMLKVWRDVSASPEHALDSVPTFLSTDAAAVFDRFRRSHQRVRDL